MSVFSIQRELVVSGFKVYEFCDFLNSVKVGICAEISSNVSSGMLNPTILLKVD